MKIRGRNTAKVVTVLARMAGGDLLGPLNSGLLRRTRLPKAEDVLENHDGVVHEHAHAQGQAAQGHEVQGEAAEVHEGEGGDHGDGDARGHDGGASDVPEKDEQDQDRQQAAVGQGRSHVRDGPLDVIGRVDDGNDVDLREVPVDLLELLKDGTRHGDRVGAGLLVDGPCACPAGRSPRTMRLTFSQESSTPAISRSRIGAPSRTAITASRSSSRLAYSPGVRTMTSMRPRSRGPAGMFTLPARIVSRICSRERDRALTLSAWRLTWISRSRPP